MSAAYPRLLHHISSLHHTSSLHHVKSLLPTISLNHTTIPHHTSSVHHTNSIHHTISLLYSFINSLQLEEKESILQSWSKIVELQSPEVEADSAYFLMVVKVDELSDGKRRICQSVLGLSK